MALMIGSSLEYCTNSPRCSPAAHADQIPFPVNFHPLDVQILSVLILLQAVIDLSAPRFSFPPADRRKVLSVKIEKGARIRRRVQSLPCPPGFPLWKTAGSGYCAAVRLVHAPAGTGLDDEKSPFRQSTPPRYQRTDNNPAAPGFPRSYAGFPRRRDPVAGLRETENSVLYQIAHSQSPSAGVPVTDKQVFPALIFADLHLSGLSRKGSFLSLKNSIWSCCTWESSFSKVSRKNSAFAVIFS